MDNNGSRQTSVISFEDYVKQKQIVPPGEMPGELDVEIPEASDGDSVQE